MCNPDLQNLGLAVLVPLQASIAYPSSMNALAAGYSPWDDTTMLINAAPNNIMTPQDEFDNLHVTEGMHGYFLLCVLLVSFLLVD